jgi:formylglycine-generating enzyme required for sulfatase activity
LLFGAALNVVFPRLAQGVPASPHEPELGPEPPEPHEDTRFEPQRVKLVDGMLHIPGGTFTMGNDGPLAGEPNERPAHEVKVAPFWIDRTEVTAKDMRACVARGDCTWPLGKGTACTLSHAEDLVPINCVPWQGADGYCRAIGKRLPTEAEWELAAGGGQRIRYPWGSHPPSCAVAVTLSSNRSGSSCAGKGPLPVGAHPKGASPYGVQDMAGNVEEWVADWYADRYEMLVGASAPAAQGPAFGVAHVLRGGGWMSRPRDSRVTARSWGSSNEAGPNVGFRCARD